MNYVSRRDLLIDLMQDHSVAVLYSGTACFVSADEYYPFEANRNFFYLTGLRRENMILVIRKDRDHAQTTLYIDECDPLNERWTGKMVTKEEASSVSGIQNVRYVNRFDRELNMLASVYDFDAWYFDCYRHQPEDLPHYNLFRANEFSSAHPAARIRNLWPLVSSLRMKKDECETALLKKAIDVTGESLIAPPINS